MKTTFVNADRARAQLLPAEVQPGTSPCPRPTDHHDPPWAQGSGQAAPGIPWGKGALRGCHAPVRGQTDGFCMKFIWQTQQKAPVSGHPTDGSSGVCPDTEPRRTPLPSPDPTARLFSASLSCWLAEFCAKRNKSPRVTRGCRQAHFEFWAHDLWKGWSNRTVWQERG